MDVRLLADIALATCRLYELYLLDQASHTQLAQKMEELYELASEYMDDSMDT
tara:strand:+ start:234 stop:389 length:156 start_codon:yes stop_codon:yes gene_type:complete